LCGSPFDNIATASGVRWAGDVGGRIETRNACRIQLGKSLGKFPIGRQTRSWENSIEINVREMFCLEGTGRGMCPTVGFDVGNVQAWRSAVRALFAYITEI
jgi:hypothetical protein